MSKKYIISGEKLYGLTKEIFRGEGLCEEHADSVAKSLVEANLRGTDSHGVVRVENYIKRLRNGGAKPNTKCTTISETPTTIAMDGNNGLGAVVSQQVCEIVRKKAQENNIAFGVARESNHFGAASYWASKLASDDMIGFAGSNVQLLMVAIGSKKPAIGNNPIAISVPAEKHANVCLDMACSTVATGRILEYRHKGEPLPDGWAVDEEGEFTNDPWKGLLCTPFGGHKGFGIAVIIEILCSLLASGAYGKDVGNMYDILDKPNRLSHFYGAIKISAFRSLAEFRRDVDGFIDQLKGVQKKTGVNEIYYPGEIEATRRNINETKGIILLESLVNELADYAKENDVAEEYVNFLFENGYE